MGCSLSHRKLRNDLLWNILWCLLSNLSFSAAKALITTALSRFGLACTAETVNLGIRNHIIFQINYSSEWGPVRCSCEHQGKEEDHVFCCRLTQVNRVVRQTQVKRVARVGTYIVCQNLKWYCLFADLEYVRSIYRPARLSGERFDIKLSRALEKLFRFDPAYTGHFWQEHLPCQHRKTSQDFSSIKLKKTASTNHLWTTP